jgi:hypothetical protein
LWFGICVLVFFVDILGLFRTLIALQDIPYNSVGSPSSTVSDLMAYDRASDKRIVFTADYVNFSKLDEIASSLSRQTLVTQFS